MEEDDEIHRRCGFCESSSPSSGNLMKCSGCLITYYCNREHQVADWKRHKILCKELQAKRREKDRSHSINVARSTAEVFSEANRPTPFVAQNSLAERTIQSLPTILPIRSIDPPNQSIVAAQINVIQSTQSPRAAMPPVNIAIKEERIDSCVENIPQRASVIQMASASSYKPQGAIENKKRSRPEKEGPPVARKNKRSTSSAASGKALVSGSLSTDEEFGPKRDHSLNYPLDLERDSRFRGSNNRNDAASRLAKMGQFVAASLREYGWAMVDKFIGERHCRAILKETQGLQEKGLFTEARMMISKSGTQLQGVRSDTVMFLTNGSDEGINIGLLVAMIDSLIFLLAGSIPPYNISGRTRPMLTCYPGQRSRYITHVDNPNNDGRCITATYYLNEDWRPAHGGLLRLYPVNAFKPVDIEPIFDRLVLYWSDRRNPHEVLPSYRKRFSVNVWYFDRDEKAAFESHYSHCDRASGGGKSTG